MKIRLHVRTDRIGSEVERIIDIDDEDWNDMDGKERDDYMFDELLRSKLFEWGYDEVEQ